MNKTVFDNEQIRLNNEIRKIEEDKELVRLRSSIIHHEEEQELHNFNALILNSYMEEQLVLNGSHIRRLYLIERQRELLLKDTQERNQFLNEGIEKLNRYIYELEEKEELIRKEKEQLKNKYECEKGKDN